MTTRVLIVLTSSARRGAEVEGSQLAHELTCCGLDASVVALGPGPSDAAPLDVRTLGERALSLRTLRALRAEGRRYDVVVAFGSTTLPACALALGRRTPFVYRSIGDPARWVRGGWHRRRTGVLFRRAVRVVALWPTAADAIATLYGIRRDTIACIPNARPSVIDGSLDRATACAALGLPASAVVVAWVGALSTEKRPVMAVESVAATRDAWLLMVGEGPLADEVSTATARLLPDRHLHTGPLADLAPVWAAADVVLLTSATEGMPGVLLEAALHGVPAVATDVGAVDRIVLDGVTGRVVAADAGPAAIAGALAAAVAHADEWGSAARDHATATFTWRTVAPVWAALLADVGSRSR
jgi:glycosyltransferase involved in cell wall biosynthesis